MHFAIYYIISDICHAQQTYEPHQYTSRAAGKILLKLVGTSLMTTEQLLLLSGDVEVNPGPLGEGNISR